MDKRDSYLMLTSHEPKNKDKTDNFLYDLYERYIIERVISELIIRNYTNKVEEEHNIMKVNIYFNSLKVKEHQDVVKLFLRTLIDTNRGHNFFVNWGKVEEHVNKYKIELNILNTLIGSRNFNKDLTKILNEYPQVLPAIPILIANRPLKLKVIKDFMDSNSDTIKYNFKRRKLNQNEIYKFIIFFHKTGLKYFFENMAAKSIQDYVTGVEVGMDTHARKNRSGDAMELALQPLLEEINIRNNNQFNILSQVYFKELRNFGFNVSPSIANRKADFIIIKGKKVVNIEVNFFRGSGSKPQEIVDSYINRQKELKENGFYFIWVTEGYGWKGQLNQLSKAFRNIDYLFNLHFVRQSLLENMLLNI